MNGGIACVIVDLFLRNLRRSRLSLGCRASVPSHCFPDRPFEIPDRTPAEKIKCLLDRQIQTSRFVERSWIALVNRFAGPMPKDLGDKVVHRDI